MAQHQSKVEEALEQAKALRKAMKSGKLAAEVNLRLFIPQQNNTQVLVV